MNKKVARLFLMVAFLISMGVSRASAQNTVELTYGQAFTLNFHLIDTTGANLKSDAVCASGDVVIMKDQGAEASTTNCFVDRGMGYSITLTAAELQASQVTLYVVDQTVPKVWLDKVIHINLTKTAPVGTAQAGCTAPCNTIQLASTAPATDDIYNNNFTLAITGGTGLNQSQCITDYAGSTKTASVASNWITAPDSTSQYVLLYTPNCTGAIGTGGITSATLANSALDAISGNIFGKVYETEGNITVQQFLKYAGSVLFGRSDSNGLRFKTPNNNANRVTTTVDSNKNRTSITLTP